MSLAVWYKAKDLVVDVDMELVSITLIRDRVHRCNSNNSPEKMAMRMARALAPASHMSIVDLTIENSKKLFTSA